MASSSSPGIIYALPLVARGTCVLAEFTTTSGNFTTVTRRILEKIPSEDSKMSYAPTACWMHRPSWLCHSSRYSDLLGLALMICWPGPPPPHTHA